ncbi:MAG TPA: nucleotide exchange factor GrpE [Geminicoccaceae bacterium]
MMQNDRRDEAKIEDAGPGQEAQPGHEAPPDEAAAADETPEAGGEASPDEQPGLDVATYEELRAELDETRDRLMRSLAEIENLRRRHARELEEARRYAITGFARELLDVADNLQRAIASIPPKAREKIDLIRTLADGVAMTERTLLASFERHQMAKVEPVPGEKFDHNRHQAMFEVATADQPPGTIAQVVQPGYVIADRLLRPAMVGVAKAPPQPAAADAGGAPSADGAEAAGEAAGQPPGERVDTTA